jgi:hypothetical protein
MNRPTTMYDPFHRQVSIFDLELNFDNDLIYQGGYGYV